MSDVPHPPCHSREECDAFRKALTHNPIRVSDSFNNLGNDDIGAVVLNTEFVANRFSLYNANQSIAFSFNRGVSSNFGAFALSKRLPRKIRQKFYAAVIEVKPGALRFATHYSNAVNPPAYDRAKAQRKPLSIRNLEQIFIIVTCGFGLALVMFSGEVIARQFENSNYY